jgi:hypothetical protein
MSEQKLQDDLIDAGNKLREAAKLIAEARALLENLPAGANVEADQIAMDLGMDRPERVLEIMARELRSAAWR